MRGHNRQINMERTRTIHSSRTVGVSAADVTVECQMTPGIGIHVVGLADAAVKESLLRTVTAMQACGYRIPGKKTVINLSPADPRNLGAGHDLPIALALIAASGQDGGRLDGLEGWIAVGELGLDGRLRETPGCVQAVMTAIEDNLSGVIIPKHNVDELADLFNEGDIPIYEVEDLNQAVSVIAGEGIVRTIWDNPSHGKTENQDSEKPVSAMVPVDEGTMRALEIAAAGGHHLLLMGPAGSGKAKVAKALRDILPPMSREEALSVASVYSAAGKGGLRAAEPGGAHRRPFRNPWRGSSLAAMLGGGRDGAVVPGEVSLSSGGVLCLEEIAETPKSVLEALRGPLDDRSVTISRLSTKVTMPAAFQLVACAAPCPCGHHGDGGRCVCTQGQREAYLSRISGPIYDRLTTQVWVSPPAGGRGAPVETLEAVAGRVASARERQMARQGCLNEDLRASRIEATLSSEARETLENIMDRMGLSCRAYSRILKMARTIADLSYDDDIQPRHVAEASSYRFLDRMTTRAND